MEDNSKVRIQNLLSRIQKIEPKEVPVPVFNGNKISLRNAMFSFSVGSDELLSDASNHASTKGPIEVIIIKAAHISRSYFEKQYDEDKPSKPMCWSDDTRTGRPSSHVSDEARQAINCFECVWNVRGSGKGESRGCRFHQRIAVMVLTNGSVIDTNLYQLQLPATSVFGDNPQKMSMQAYAKHLNSFKTPLAAVVTEIYFDKSSSVSKLLFKPKRAITEDEYLLAVAAQQDSKADKILSSSLDVQSPFTPVEGFTFK